MSHWPSVVFENEFLKQVAFELRKRHEAIRLLAVELRAHRVDDIEETDGGGGINHQRLDLLFFLRGEPPPKVDITVYDDGTFILRTNHPFDRLADGKYVPGKFELALEGGLPVKTPHEVAALVEQTLRLAQLAVQNPTLCISIRELWEVPASNRLR